MDFNRKQLDSLSLGYYMGVMSYKDNLIKQDNLGLVKKSLKSKMLSLYFAVANWLNYHKGFSVMAIVIKNNRIHCQTYVWQLNIVAQIKNYMW